VSSAINIVWRVADNNEPVRFEIHSQVFLYSLSRKCWKVASIVRLIPESARQVEERRESHQIHF
jgi:hypothetical protein